MRGRIWKIFILVLSLSLIIGSNVGVYALDKIQIEEILGIDQEKSNEEAEDEEMIENNEELVEDKEIEEDKEAEIKEVLITSVLSVNAELIKYGDTVRNGEYLYYDLIVSNGGDLDIHNLSISDNLSLGKTIPIIYPGETVKIEGKYYIDLYNELTEIDNTVNISLVHEEESLHMDLSFLVNIEILKGSITITNLVEDSLDSQLEFDIFVDGPEGREYIISLRDGESQIIDNLPLGEYWISSIVPMNYSGFSPVNISIVAEDLYPSLIVEHYSNNYYGFSHSAKEVIEIKMEPRHYQASMGAYKEEKLHDYIFETFTIIEKIEVEPEEIEEDYREEGVGEDEDVDLEEPLEAPIPIDPGIKIEPIDPIEPEDPFRPVNPIDPIVPREPIEVEEARISFSKMNQQK